MSKTAKIDSFKEGKQLTHGKVYTITFDNGDTGEAILKQEPAIGESWEYDLEPNGTYPDKIKRNKEGGKTFNKGGGYQKEPFEEKTVGMSYAFAKDLTVAGKLEPGKKMIETANAIYDAMLETAKRGRV